LAYAGGSGELWRFGFGEAHAFGQDDAKAVEESVVRRSMAAIGKTT